MIAIGLDPGTKESAVVIFSPDRNVVVDSFHVENEKLLLMLTNFTMGIASTVLVIEKIESMGMAVGAETMETIYWSGRFHQAFKGRVERVTRRQVKLHLCGSMRAKDANIRQALLDKFGGKSAVGRKASPGPLWGISAHKWSALAVAITFLEAKDADGQQQDRGAVRAV